MKDKFRILIAGGDMRQISCAERLSAVFDTAILGFDEEYLGDGASSTVTHKDENGKYDCAVLPVPPLDEKGMLCAPCCKETLSPYKVKELIKSGGIIFAGRADDRLREMFAGYDICDYMQREEVSLKNAVPTAEGAVRIALEELPVTLNGLKVLVVGLGRIGMALTGILKGFGADVTAAVRNSTGAAKARILGIKSVYTSRMDTKYALVFNTVPSLIFDRELLSRFDSKTLFIDLASKPGGIDFDSAAELGKRVVWALGLPGKSAPVTSGEIIAETIAEVLGERGETNV